MVSHSSPKLPSAYHQLLFLSILGLGLFSIRMFGPSNLRDNDQERPAAYVLDALQNGNWICQEDFRGELSSKPPLYTWLVALATLPFHRINRFALYLPGALATLGMAWLILHFGSRHFGRGAGWFAAIAYLISLTSIKQMALARTDPLFALTVFATALCVYRSWIRGSGWTWFWILGALATLTKGPLGLLLALGGLLSVRWERRSEGRIPLKGSHLPGVILFLVITLGWFILAYLAKGQALIDKLFFKELVGHAIMSGKGRFPGEVFYQPPFYFLSRFAPWSLFAIAGFWRVWKSPSGDTSERRFERFLFCYFFFGLLLFMIAPHQRADHLFPLLPAAALLAGREIARLIFSKKFTSHYFVTVILCILVLFFTAVYFWTLESDRGYIVKSRGLSELAKDLRQQVGSQFPLIHLDAPYTLQFYLNTLHPIVSVEQAARALLSDEAAFVAVRNQGEELKKQLGPDAPPIHVVAQWPPSEEPYIQILSNHPRLEYTDRMTTYAGPIRIRMNGLHLQKTKNNQFQFWAKQPYGTLELYNESDILQSVQIRILNTKPELFEKVDLAPGASKQISFGRQKRLDENLKIGQLADCRQAYAHREWLARHRAFADLDYLFVNGDFVFESDWRYDVFLNQAQEWEVPIFPILGNHDIIKKTPYLTESFQNRFGYLTHCFDDGPARFILLETGQKILGENQLEQLEEFLKKEPVPPRRLIFQHVPPDGFRPGNPEDRQEMKREIAIAARAGVDRIYCGHINGYFTRDYATEDGSVRVIISSGGGEKAYEKVYQLHWLEMNVSPEGITEIQQNYPLLSRMASLKAHLLYQDLFVLTRIAPGILFFLVLSIVLLFFGRETLRAVASSAPWFISDKER